MDATSRILPRLQEVTARDPSNMVSWLAEEDGVAFLAGAAD
jgi:hypothetical protein